MDFSKVSTELLDAAGQKQELGPALRMVFEVLDPKNEHDLGGEAGVWFSGLIQYQAPADNGWTAAREEDAWPYIDPTERSDRLRNFFDYIREAYTNHMRNRA